MTVKLALCFFLATVAVAHCASLLDFLNLEDAKKLVEVAGATEPRETPSCKWKCKGPACACCIEQNLTFYDPEGTKCVHMRYLSKQEGMFVQLSHGKKVEHDNVYASNSSAVCLVSGLLFQMCASFAHMESTPEGMNGCVYLDPGTIFLTERKIPLGCFKTSNATMEMSEPIDAPAAEEEEEETATDSNIEDNAEFDPNKFFAGVYQTAQQSIALLSSLIETSNPTWTAKPNRPNEATTSAPAEPQESATTSQRRAPKNLKHPNQL